MNKQQQWQKCQEKAPKIAEFLTQVSKIMGKPSAVKVEIDGEIIIKSNQFDKPKLPSRRRL